MFSVLGPLLPVFQEKLTLSKTEAGLLVAMFSVGWVFAALPVGLLAPRVGLKPSLLVGLITLALSSVTFALVGRYNGLLLARFLQGAACLACWSIALAWLVESTSRRRRSETIGMFTGAAAAGAMTGPAMGGLATIVGRLGAFSGIAAAAVVLAVVGVGLAPPPRGDVQSLKAISRVHRERTVLVGQWLVTVPALLLGMVSVLAPLQLTRDGWGPLGVAVTFLVAASVGVLARPIVGRWADRHNQLNTIRALFVLSIPVTIVIPWMESRWVLSICVVFAVTTYGVFWSPAMAVLSHAYEAAGSPQSVAFPMMALTLGVGLFAGSAVSGVIADLAGDGSAYGLAVAICLLTLLGLTLRPCFVRVQAFRARFSGVSRP